MRLIGDPPHKYKRPYHLYCGAKIKFAEEKQAYTIQAASKRYTICTKPFNAQKTVLYCIIDWKESWRGPEDLVFGAGAKTREECLEMLVRLLDGESDISVRHYTWLNIDWIKHGKELIVLEEA
jgi:hypothetical protein